VARPSRQLKKFAGQMAGEIDYDESQYKQVEIAQEIKRGTESVFGTALYMAIEDLERSAYLNMANTSPLRLFKQIELRKELGVVQYIKAKLDSYITNGNAIEENMKLLMGVYDEEDDT